MIYEVRTYTLRPGAVAEFEERFAKRLPLRGNLKLGAFWHTGSVRSIKSSTSIPTTTRNSAAAARAELAQDTARQRSPAEGTRSWQEAEIANQ